jgi:hypothetical protein
MTWMWVVLFLVVIFAMGIGTALAFRKPHAPDRRVGGDRRQGDRRRGDRRSGGPNSAAPRELWTEERRAAFRVEHGLPTPDPHDTSVWTDERRAQYRALHGFPRPDIDSGLARHSVDRRQGERRKGERRKKQPWWPKATVVTSAVLLSIIGVVAYGETQVPSIFNDSNPALSGSGWANCETPVTWSLDTSRLSPSDAAVAVEQMTGDFTKWGQASGLKFKYVGEIPTIYSDSTFVLSSDTHPSDRHIFVAFLHDADSSMLDERTVGMASPTKVFASDKEIVEGSVVLEIEYVKKANRLHRSSLYLHEMGHALGLGHGGTAKDTMYYIVDTTNELSPADIAGIKALTKVCSTSVPLG